MYVFVSNIVVKYNILILPRSNNQYLWRQVHKEFAIFFPQAHEVQNPL
jgi:hypothetical protein